MARNNRSDKSIFFIFKTILLNNRLKSYMRYIELAKRHGYKVCSMKDFFEGKDQPDVKHFVLRHDVDHVTSATKKMYETEIKCGVRSTYYFRFCTMDITLIKEMLSNGFEIGLHYETISDYAKKYQCTSMAEIDISDLREAVKSDIEKFNNMVGYKMTSCAGHGTPENTKLNCSNNILLEGQNMEEYGLAFEAYDKNLYEQYIQCHIMDGNIRNNYGFSYVDNPINAIQSEKRNIIFLAHPNHWYFTSKIRLEELYHLMRGQLSFTTNRQFKRISGLEYL